MPPLQFLNQIFLVGLAAASLPILIHLFSRRRAREVPFPSLEFLQEVSRKKVRRLQLRQILLLLLRVLIIAFFALAMGRPAMQTDGGGLGRGSSTVAIVLDNSYSMAAHDPASSGLPSVGSSPRSTSPVPEEGTVFEVAKRRALEVISLMKEGDRGVLALAATPVHLPYQAAITDLGLFRQETERAPLAATPADLPQAVERVAAALSASRTLNRELYIISDFQRIDIEAWQTMIGQERDSTTANRTGNTRLPEGVRVYLVPARSLPVDNLAIERVRLDLLGAGAERGARLIVSVINHSDEEARDVVVRALGEGEGGEALGEAFVTIPPAGRSEATLLLRRLPTEGNLRVSLAPDPLNWDNSGYLVTEQPGVRRILIISSNSDAASEPAVRHAKLALDPKDTQEFFKVDVVGADDPALASNLRADVVVLLNVGRLPAATLEQIERFRAEGGGVLVVMGDSVDPRMYNTAIFPKLADLELLGLQGDPDQPDVYRSLRIATTGHPIFAGFPATVGENLTSARIQRFLDAKVGVEARVLAEFSGGFPALIEDRGTLVYTSAFDGRWSDLPTSGAFVPLLHRMINYLLAQSRGSDRLLAGGAIEETIDPEQLANQEAHFVGPRGLRIGAERSQREGKVHLRSEPIGLPGIYQLAREDGVRLGLYAVNLDARESDLRLAPESWLPALFEPDATVLKPEREITRSLIEARYGRELWPILLMMVLGLMVGESLLGRGRLLP